MSCPSPGLPQAVTTLGFGDSCPQRCQEFVTPAVPTDVSVLPPPHRLSGLEKGLNLGNLCNPKGGLTPNPMDDIRSGHEPQVVGVHRRGCVPVRVSLQGRVGTAVTVTRAAGPTGDKGQSTVPAGAAGAALGHVPPSHCSNLRGCAPCAAVAQLAQGWELCPAWQRPGREERTGWAPGAAGIGWDEARVGSVLTLAAPPTLGRLVRALQ